MDFYKLDKIDKIVISIVFIFVALFSILNNFVFADDEEVISDYTRKDNTSIVDGVLTEQPSGYYVAVYDIEPGYLYTFTAINNWRSVGLSDSVEYGTILKNFSTIAQNESFSFYSDISCKFFISQTGASEPGILTRVPAGYGSAIQSLTGSVSGQLIWDSILSAMPFILVVVIFPLGRFFIHEFLRKANSLK